MTENGVGQHSSMFDPLLWLRDQTSARVLLIEAGAGYGKTAACAKLREAAVLDGGTVIDLDPRDLADLDHRSRRAAGLYGRVLFLLDAYERIADRALDDALAEFARMMDAGVRLVIASRAEVDIPFGQLRIDGGVLRVSEASLRLQRGEAEAMLGGHLDPAAVGTVLDWSEGWPLAIAAVRDLARRRPQDTPAPPVEDLLAAADAVLGAWARDEVLRPLDPASLQVLTDTAFVEDFNCELVEELTDLGDGWALIEGLRRKSLLSLARKGEDRWYRCHPILRRALRAELLKRGRSELTKLSRRAAEWFWARRDLVRALTCADIAGDSELAAKWALSTDTAMLGVADGAHQLSAVMDHIPADAWGRLPRLLLARAFLAAKADSGDLAERIVRDVRTRADAGAFARDPMLMRDLAIAEVAIAMYGGQGLGEASLPAIGVIEAASSGDDRARGMVDNLLCAVAFEASDFPKALSHARNAQHFYARRSSANGLGYIHLHAGRVHVEMAEPDEAIKRYVAAQPYFASLCSGDAQSLRLLTPLLARAHYDRGRFEEAGSLCGLFRREVDRGGYYNDALYTGFRTLAALASLRGNVGEARDVLDDAIAFARTRGADVLHRMLRLERALVEPEPDAFVSHAQLALGDGMVDASATRSWRLRDLEAMVRTRLVLASGDGEGAVVMLSAQAEECSAQGRVRSLLDMRVRLALTFDAIGQRNSALSTLAEAVRQAARHDVIAPFLDGGREVAMLLSLLASRTASDGRDQDFIGRVIEHRGEHRYALEIALSKREVEILRLLAAGMSNKLIARELDISPDTVRYHLKGIYQKYGMTSGHANRRVLTRFVGREGRTWH